MPCASLRTSFGARPFVATCARRRAARSPPACPRPRRWRRRGRRGRARSARRSRRRRRRPRRTRRRPRAPRRDGAPGRRSRRRRRRPRARACRRSAGASSIATERPGRHQHVRGEAAVAVVARHLLARARVAAPRATERAVAARKHGGHDHRAPRPALARLSGVDHAAHDLVTEHQRQRVPRRDRALGVPEVRVAEPTRLHLDQSLARTRSGQLDRPALQRLARLHQHPRTRFHAGLPSGLIASPRTTLPTSSRTRRTFVRQGAA